MRYNDFNGEKVSSLGFGTMRLPMHDNGEINYEAGAEMVEAAMKNGITYFDTAYKYHKGEAENFCGAVLSKYPRESYTLADKLPTWLCNTTEDAERIFNEQLEKCNVNYFDYYLLHSIDEGSWPDIEKVNLVDFMIKKRNQVW